MCFAQSVSCPLPSSNPVKILKLKDDLNSEFGVYASERFEPLGVTRQVGIVRTK